MTFGFRLGEIRRRGRGRETVVICDIIIDPVNGNSNFGTWTNFGVLFLRIRNLWRYHCSWKFTLEGEQGGDEFSHIKLCVYVWGINGGSSMRCNANVSPGSLSLSISAPYSPTRGAQLCRATWQKIAVINSAVGNQIGQLKCLRVCSTFDGIPTSCLMCCIVAPLKNSPKFNYSSYSSLFRALN